MNDLISRKELLEVLSEAEANYKAENHECIMDNDPFSNGILSAMFSVFQIVNEQPTAYSVDEVVEQGGTSDDVCEWRKHSICGFYSEHEGAVRIINIADGYKYCPYCGKKIKVVQ